MPDRIKGITIEIGGDTTGLSKALKDVNSDLRTAQNGLKDVNSLLKLDPSNVELLRQKQGYLNDAIASTEEKLQKEKEALEQMKNADGFDKNSEQAKALERQIAADEQALKKLKEESKSFGNVASQQFKNVADKVKAVGDKIGSVGKEMSTKVTAPLVAVGAASVAAFKEVDAAEDILIKKTGATGDAFNEMNDIVQDIATQIPVSFETAANAVGEVNTRFGVTGDQLDRISTQYVKFAEINETDVVGAIDQSQKALAAFGLGAESAEALLDRLTLTGQQTGASMDTLLSGLVSNSAAFSEMGLSIDQAVGFMGQMEVSGADSSAVMSGLSKALKNATADGIPLNQALSELQNTIVNGTESTDGLTAAYDLFGKSGAQVFEAVRNGSLDFTALATSAQDATGALSDTFNETLDPLDEWQTTLNQVKIVGAELGSTLGEVLLPIVQKVAEVVKDLTEKFKALTPEQQETIVKVGMIVAAVGPALVILGKLVTGVGSVISILGTLVGVLGGPVTLVIAAVIAAGVALITHWDLVKEKCAALGKWISEKFTAIKTAVTEKVTAMKTSVTEKWDAMKQSVTDKANAIKETALNVFTAIKNGITDKINAAKEAVRTAIDHIKNFLNFHWELPHLALPHFSISGSINPMDWFTQGVPHISVEWYRKAYNNPVMFTRPTVLQTPSGYKGFGDGAGAEVVMGLNKLKDIAGETNIQINVYGAEGQNVNQLAEEIERRLVKMQQQRSAVWA